MKIKTINNLWIYNNHNKAIYNKKNRNIKNHNKKILTIQHFLIIPKLKITLIQ